MAKQQRKQPGTWPVLPAFIERVNPDFPTALLVSVWCGSCRAWHGHGAPDVLKAPGQLDRQALAPFSAGHRVAHCTNDESPYRETGYMLVVLPALTKRQVKALTLELTGLAERILRAPNNGTKTAKPS